MVEPVVLAPNVNPVPDAAVVALAAPSVRPAVVFCPPSKLNPDVPCVAAGAAFVLPKVKPEPVEEATAAGCPNAVPPSPRPNACPVAVLVAVVPPKLVKSGVDVAAFAALNPPRVRFADGVAAVVAAPKLNPVDEVEGMVDRPPKAEVPGALAVAVVPKAESPPDCVAAAPNVVPAKPVLPESPLPKANPVDPPPKVALLVVFGCVAPN